MYGKGSIPGRILHMMHRSVMTARQEGWGIKSRLDFKTPSKEKRGICTVCWQLVHGLATPLFQFDLHFGLRMSPLHACP